jgi:hypothetical protein
MSAKSIGISYEQLCIEILKQAALDHTNVPPLSAPTKG